MDAPLPETWDLLLNRIIYAAGGSGTEKPGHCSDFFEFLEAVLFMKLPDELFDLGDAALED